MGIFISMGVFVDSKLMLLGNFIKVGFFVDSKKNWVVKHNSILTIGNVDDDVDLLTEFAESSCLCRSVKVWFYPRKILINEDNREVYRCSFLCVGLLYFLPRMFMIDCSGHTTQTERLLDAHMTFGISYEPIVRPVYNV